MYIQRSQLVHLVEVPCIDSISICVPGIEWRTHSLWSGIKDRTQSLCWLPTVRREKSGAPIMVLRPALVHWNIFILAGTFLMPFSSSDTNGVERLSSRLLSSNLLSLNIIHDG